MNNKKSKQAREVFLDFTMNDDNNLLEQINEIDKSFALNIPSEASKVTHAKVTMPKNEDKGNHVNNMRKSNLSIDLAGTNEIQPMTLDDLVKETEGLIETISETVQETAKISAHKNDFIRELETTNELLAEELPVAEEVDTAVVFDAEPVQKGPEVAIDEQEAQEKQEPEVYTPHFINEELGNNGAKTADDIKLNDTFLRDDFSADYLVDEADEEKDLLEQTGSFLLNTKDLHFFSKDDDDDDDSFDGPSKPKKPTPYNHLSTNFTNAKQKADEPAVNAFQQDEKVVLDATFATSASAHEQTTEAATDVTAKEGTLVAKVEDIDVLLQKLDALSAKEMVNALPSHANRKQADALARPFVHKEEMKEQLAELANETIRATEPTIARDNTTMVGNDEQARDDTDLDGAALKLHLASVDVEQATSFEPMPKVQGLDLAQPSNEATVPNDNEKITEPKVETKATTISSKDFYNTRDLIDTQPINLADIEKLTGGKKTMQPTTDPYLVAADIPAQGMTQTDTLPRQIEQEISTQSQDVSRQRNVALKQTYEAIEAAPSEETQFDISQFEHNFEQVFGQTKTQSGDAASRVGYTDELQFEQTFQQIFNQATMQTVEDPAALMQTDELVGLHEAMIRVDGVNLEKKGQKNGGSDEKSEAGIRNEAMRRGASVATEDAAVRSTQKQRVSTINYAAYLEEDTGEHVQPGTLVDNGLAFANTDERQLDQQGERASDAVRLTRDDSNDALANNVHEQKKEREQIVPLRPTGRTKPKTFADMNTTLVNLSVLEEAAVTPTATLQAQAETTLEVSAVQSARRRTAEDTNVDDIQLNAAKRTNQVLVMTIIGLMIVILALICFIIFNMYM